MQLARVLIALLALGAAGVAHAQAAEEPVPGSAPTAPGEARAEPEAHVEVSEAGTKERAEARTEEPEVESRWSLGVRGFGGGLFSKEERVGGGGGGLLVAFGIVPERWEVELGLSVVVARERSPLGVFEVIGKGILEQRGNWAPHLLFGPLFSLDFGKELKPAGGVVLGAGLTYWIKPRVGVIADAAYRLLIGKEVEHFVTLAAGVTFRL